MSDALGFVARMRGRSLVRARLRTAGVDAGAISAGKWADFALLDLKAPALAGADDEHVLGAAVFGGSAEGLVADTCVAGAWTGGVEALSTRRAV